MTQVIETDKLRIESWPRPAQSGFRLGMPKGVHLTYGDKIQIIVDSERSQHANRHKALRALSVILDIPLYE